MNNSNSIEKFELDLWFLIEAAHRAGTNYWKLLKICLEACLDLQAKADVEYWAKLTTK